MRFARRRWSLVVFLFFHCLSFPLHAQNKPEDKAPTNPAVAALAAKLVAAKSDEERKTLLAAEKGLVTQALVDELLERGVLLASPNKYDGSVEKYDEAIAVDYLAEGVAEQIGDKEGMALCLRRIGNLYLRQGKPGMAIDPHRKSFALYEALGNKELMAVMLSNLGNAFYSLGDFPQALDHYQKGLALAEALGNKNRIALMRLGVGNAHNAQGDNTQALEHYRKGLALAESLEEKDTVAMLLAGLGGALFSQGDYDQALEYQQRSLTLAESSGNKYVVVRMLDGLGSISDHQGNYTKALEYYQKSLTLAEALGDKPSIAATLHNLGNVHYRQGSFIRALEWYQKSLVESEALEDKNGMAMALLSIGSIHRLQGNGAQALERYRQVLPLAEAAGAKSVIGRTLAAIGEIYETQDDYIQALEYYKKALTLAETSGDKELISESLGLFGWSYKSRGDYARAMEYYRKSLALAEASGNKGLILRMLKDIGEVHQKQGDHARALENAGRSIALARQIGELSMLWSAQLVAGRSYRAINQLTQARQSFAEAIATIEGLRAEVAGNELEQQRFFENKLAPYQAMIELLVAENQPVEAFTYAERAKARTLLDVLRRGRVDIAKAMVPQEQERERSLNNQLVSLNTQISRENQRSQPDAARLNDLQARLQKARLEYEAFQTALFAAHKELKAQRGEAQPLTVAQAADLLPDDQSALLEFAVMDERTFLFVLTRARSGAQGPVELKTYPVEIKRAEIDSRVARFRDALAKGSPGFRQPARELYDLLLRPAAAQLKGRTAIVIAPDGPLWELPFQALESAPNHYLLEDCAIAYAPSLTALREMNRLQERNRGSAQTPALLAFGNPALGKRTIARSKSVLMDEKLDPLPEAERQVNALKQIYGPAQSRIYIGADAREERAKEEAKGYRILHLATHGILNDSSPMYSHVLLAQPDSGPKDGTDGGNEDGLLEAWEIMKMDLKADLAVLSACETARGRVGAGEGMIGLSWALFVAGCPTSVVSQWKVDSAGTTELMLEFHRRLKSQMTSPTTPFSAARALREAALKLQRDDRYRHPFYWAGFVVAGKGF
jgi:CHAT domain-containing protein/tetratricopeptide (TPR) repeat protein